MAFNANQSIVAEYYIAALGRTPEKEGFNYWVEQLDNGAYTPATLMEKFFDTSIPEVAARYPESASNTETIALIYQNVFGREADAEGLAHWAGVLETTSKSAVLEQMLAAAKNPANYIDGEYLKAQLIKAEVELGGGSVPGETFELELGKDNIKGTDGDDIFEADLSAYENGNVANTLATGDKLDGGNGNDTLKATLINSYSNANNPIEVAPTTTSIENIIIKAELSDTYDAKGEKGSYTVTLNAKNMSGIDKISSTYSEADLLVKNMTTNGGKHTSQQTVEFAYSQNRDSNWDEANMTVYYDQDYIVRDAVQTNSLYYFTQDRLAMQEDGKPFGDETAVDGIRFNIGDEEIIVKIDADKLAAFLKAVPAGQIAAYREFTELLKEALAEKNAELNGALDGYTIELDTSYYRTNGGKDNGGNPLAGPAYAIVLTAPDNVQISNPAMNQNTQFLPTYDMFNDVATGRVNADKSASINVELEKVGLAGNGGGLIVGSMNKTTDNVFNAKESTTKTVAGFDEINVTVNGAEDKASSLSYLHSTNNTLRTVTVESEKRDDNSYADLKIGNANTDVVFGTSAANAEAFKDVQVFDASAFKGNLTLNAGITSEIVAKYLANTTNTKLNGLNDVRTELAKFTYDAGSGNDYLNIAIDGSALSTNFKAVKFGAAGTAVAGMLEFTVTDTNSTAAPANTAVIYYDAANTQYLTAAGYVVSIADSASNPGEFALVYDDNGTFKYLVDYAAGDFTAPAGAVVAGDDAPLANHGTVATQAPFAPSLAYTLAGTVGDDTNGTNVFDMDINGNDGDDTIVVNLENKLNTDVVHSGTNITINGGNGDDIIDISKNATDWTFTVAFNGNFGTDTIKGFNLGVVDTSDETQTLDLTAFEARAGEVITVTVGEFTTTFTANAYMDTTAIQNKVQAMLEAENPLAVVPANPEYLNTQKFDFGSVNVTPGSKIDLTALDRDVKSVTVEVKNGSVVKNSATSETLEQGGIKYSNVDTEGADVLDFTAYDAKALKVVEYTVDTDIYQAEAVKATTLGITATDKVLVLIESIHKQGLYDVYESENSKSTAQTLADGNKVGSIDFSDTTLDISSADDSQFLI